MKSKKEIKSLIALSRALGQPLDSDLVEELRLIETKELEEQQFRQTLLEKTFEGIQDDLKEIFSGPVTKPSIVEENKKEIPIPELTIVEKTASEITKAEKIKESISPFTPPTPAPVPPEFASITKKLKFLEEWIQKISATGPGGGAGEIYNLDFPTKAVTQDYHIQRKDYYIGVNCDVKCNVYLPEAGNNLKAGRIVVIKDESGHAQLTPIKIVGTIDNDSNGAELRINNGAVTLLYRNGWRII